MELDIERQTDEQKLLNAFAEEISSMKANPHCKYCRDKGNRGFYGIGIDPKGNKYLLICCGQIGETEYVRLQKRIIEMELQLVDLENHVRKQFEVLAETVLEQFLWNKIKRLFR